MVKRSDTLPPPPFWRTRYFTDEVMVRPDRRGIEVADVALALTQPTHRQTQPDGRLRHWVWIEARQKWLRVVIEPDGETVHNAFWDRTFKP